MKALLDLVLPVECAGCRARSVVACAACLAALRGPARPAWPRPSPPGLPPPVAVAAYDGPVRSLLLAMKEHGVTALDQPLGGALARAVRTAAGSAHLGPVTLVPVPSSRAARRRRGEDVVRRLATVAANELRRAGRPARVVPALRHARVVSDSAGLGAADRAHNLAGAFVARPRSAGALAGGLVVVVDDVITTGVTLAECSAALRAVGCVPRACATVAATQRHSPPRAAQPPSWALPSQGQVPPTDGRDHAWTSL